MRYFCFNQWNLPIFEIYQSNNIFSSIYEKIFYSNIIFSGEIEKICSDGGKILKDIKGE